MCHIKTGAQLLCYIISVSRWCAVLLPAPGWWAVYFWLPADVFSYYCLFKLLRAFSWWVVFFLAPSWCAWLFLALSWRTLLILSPSWCTALLPSPGWCCDYLAPGWCAVFLLVPSCCALFLFATVSNSRTNSWDSGFIFNLRKNKHRSVLQI
jgi:hypothetical protein